MEKIDYNESLKLKIISIDKGDFYIYLTNYRRKTVLDIKKQIEKNILFPIDSQRLIYLGKVLKDDQKLYEINVTSESAMHLVKNSTNQLTTENIQNNVNNGSSIDNLLSNLRNTNNTLGSLLSILNSFDGSNSLFIRSNSETYLHLIRNRTSYDKNKAYEVITQNILNIKNLINTLVPVERKSKDNNKINKIFKLEETQYRVGQWVDFCDTLGIWFESQIEEIDKVNKKYKIKLFTGSQFNTLLGLNSNIQSSEIIDFNSERIKPFRTKTVQSPFSMYMSPSLNSNANNAEERLFFTNSDEERLSSINNLVEFFDILRPRLINLIHEKECLNLKKENIRSFVKKDHYDDYNIRHSVIQVNNVDIEEEISIRERQVFLSIAIVAPLIDRIGRFMTDLSTLMFNMNFDKFNKNINLFRENIDEYISSYRESYPNIDIFDQKVKLNLFEDICNVPAMRIPGEIAENSAILRPRIIIQTGGSSINNDNINSIQDSNQISNNIRNSNNTNNNNNIIPRSNNLKIEKSSFTIENKIIKKSSMNKIMVSIRYSIEKEQKKFRSYLVQTDKVDILTDSIGNKEFVESKYKLSDKVLEGIEKKEKEKEIEKVKMVLKHNKKRIISNISLEKDNKINPANDLNENQSQIINDISNITEESEKNKKIIMNSKRMNNNKINDDFNNINQSKQLISSILNKKNDDKDKQYDLKNLNKIKKTESRSIIKHNERLKLEEDNLKNENLDNKKVEYTVINNINLINNNVIVNDKKISNKNSDSLINKHSTKINSFNSKSIEKVYDLNLKKNKIGNKSTYVVKFPKIQK